MAHGSHVEIPVHFTSTTINTASVNKFKFPLKTPPPNKIQDKRPVLQIFQDMLSILGDTPRPNYKFYLDLLLKRDSSLPEIDKDGIELSTELIKKSIKEFAPKLEGMKANYLENIEKNIVTNHVKLSLPSPEEIPQGPLIFLKATIPDSNLPSHNLPLLVDTGATNSCISINTLSSLGINEEDICTEIQYCLTNVTENKNKVQS